MTAFVFTPASKSKRKARIALEGPSGSGKTYTALTIATVLAESVAVIDTERGSASLYSGPDGFSFDHLDLYSFSPDDLVRALAAAGAAGYGCVVIDSLSHFWSGAGGMLEQVDNAGKRSGGNNFAGWKEARPMERRMIDAMLAYPGHIIVTLRTKTEYVVEQNERGKQVPRKIGTKPEQREGIEYEFDIVGDLDLDNTLVVSKSRARAIAGQVISKPDAELGRRIAAWLDDGKQTTSVGEYVERACDLSATYPDLRSLYEEVAGRGLVGAPVLDEVGNATTLGELIARNGQKAKLADSANEPLDSKPADRGPDPDAGMFEEPAA